MKECQMSCQMGWDRTLKHNRNQNSWNLLYLRLSVHLTLFCSVQTLPLVGHGKKMHERVQKLTTTQQKGNLYENKANLTSVLRAWRRKGKLSHWSKSFDTREYWVVNGLKQERSRFLSLATTPGKGTPNIEARGSTDMHTLLYNAQNCKYKR